MAALLLAPVYLLINVYVLVWILKWLGAINPCLKKKRVRIGIILLYLALSTTILSSFLFQKPLWLHQILKPASNLFLRYFLYAIQFILVFDLLRLILKRTPLGKKPFFHSRKVFILTGTLTFLLVFATGTYGYFHEKKLYTTPYEVTVEKSYPGKDTLRIALASDLHLGYNIGESHVKNLVERINSLDVDLVLFAGDMFDNEFEAVDNPERLAELLKGIESTYGSYTCFGNHDLDEPLLGGFSVGEGSKNDDQKMLDFFDKSHITLLNDEVVLVEDSFYLAGRRDVGRSKKVEDGRLTPEELLAELDKTKPIFVLDHQPGELDELSQAGADLDFSGHTHDGQMFPGNLLISLFWENPCGLLKKGEMTSIVTSGVGVWGPNMRIGTKSEVALVTVHFQ